MAKVPAKLGWKQLTPRRWKTDLGGKFPEIVILVMTNTEFKQFHSSTNAAMKFLDKSGLLKRKLIALVFVDVVDNPGGKDWIVIVSHTTHSTAGVLAWHIC